AYGLQRADEGMLSPSSMPQSWTPWRIQRCASGSPTWVRKSGRATNRRPRRSQHSKGLRSRSGGRSSRRRTSRRNKASRRPHFREGGFKMKLPRRNFLHLAAGAAALPAVTRFAWAQAYPSRPVRWIVGFAAGGDTDIIARLIGQWLSERFGQQFIIENRPGAASNIAIEAVVRARADGYTLVSVNSVNSINATLYEQLNFNL